MVAGLLAQQGHHVAGIDAPIVAQRVANLAFQQKTVGEQLVARHARQADVFDRMAERPMAQIVQQGRDDEQLGVLRAHRPRESLVVGQLLQIKQGQPIDAQAVLETRVDGRRIDQRHQAQLADPGQAAEIGRVDQSAAPAASAARRARAESAPIRDGCPERRLRRWQECRS